MTPAEVDRLLRPLILKDLRLLCRARGLNPAGGKEQLEDRLKQYMMSTGNFSVQVPNEGPEQAVPPGYVVAPQGYQQYATGVNNNNYSRPGGQQNVGNFITDKPSSHVSAPPGGFSSIQLGGYPEASPAPHYHQSPPPQAAYGSPMHGQAAYAYGASTNDVKGGSLANNYSRPGGQQNVGNFITDRPSSRVLAPPGGSSQASSGDMPADQLYTSIQRRAVITFGDYNAPPPATYARGGAAPGQGQSYGSPVTQPYGVQTQQGTPGNGYGSPSSVGQAGYRTNNYSRPSGQQNVGNFITDRPTSRVLAPPGGKSQITFG